MPNRKAKRRKQERREKDEYLSKHGRTPAQIKKKLKRKSINKIMLSYIVLLSASILYFAVHIGYWIIRDTM